MQAILGSSIFTRFDSNDILQTIIFYFGKFNLYQNINFLQRNLGRINYLEINLNNTKSVKYKKSVNNSLYIF